MKALKWEFKVINLRKKWLLINQLVYKMFLLIN